MDGLTAWLPSGASRECQRVSARPTRRTRPTARHRAATFRAGEADGITWELELGWADRLRLDAATRRGSRWLGPAAFSLRTRAMDQGLGTAWSTRKSTNATSQMRGSSHGAHVPCLLLAGLWRQRRSLGRLWWAGSIGGSSHHPRLPGLSSPGVCRPRGAALRPCAARGHDELTLLCCCRRCGAGCHNREKATVGAGAPTSWRDQAEGAGVGALGRLTV